MPSLPRAIAALSAYARLGLIALLLALAAPAFSQSATATATAPDKAQSNVAALSAQLVGAWEEFSPGRNFVDFHRDGSMKLYLKQGEVGDLKALEGTWTVDDAGELVLQMRTGNGEIEHRGWLRFEGEEMIISGEDTAETRHRPRKDAVPEEYRW